MFVAYTTMLWLWSKQSLIRQSPHYPLPAWEDYHNPRIVSRLTGHSSGQRYELPPRTPHSGSPGPSSKIPDA